MTESETTWLSLWEPLMEEAARLCIASAADPSREAAAAAAAIVLARTGWEAFANELIEQRQLSLGLKRAAIRDKLNGIFEELELSRSSWEERPVWADFLLVNDVRNFIAHQKNVARGPSDASERMLRALERARTIPPGPINSLWENRVLRKRVARWCCLTCGNAVIALEEIPTRQFRTPHHIRDRIRRVFASIWETPHG